MSPSEIDDILERLPAVQRDVARNRIHQAAALGWVDIHLDPPEGGRAHHLDLFGMHPIVQKMQMLPDLSDVKE